MKAKLSALIPIVVGLLGMVLERLMAATAFEAGSGLAVPGAKAIVLLAAFFVLILLLALAASLPMRGRKAVMENMYHIGAYGLVLGIFAALCVMAGGVLQLLQGTAQKAELAAAVLLIAAGIGMFWLAMRGSRTCGTASVWELLPGFGCCLWLICFYQDNARDPEITHYCWSLLAMMAILLALYLQARCAFGGGYRGRTLALTICAVVFGIAVLPEAESAGELLLTAGLSLWLLRRWPCLFREGE